MQCSIQYVKVPIGGSLPSLPYIYLMKSKVIWRSIGLQIWFLVEYKEKVAKKLKTRKSKQNNNHILKSVSKPYTIGYLLTTSDDAHWFGWTSSSPASAHPAGIGLVFEQ